MHFTYIIYSKSLDFFYKDSTNNIENRIKRHNSGLESYTSKGTPWILIWFTSKGSKSDAYRLELKLKNLSRDRLINFIKKYAHDIANDEVKEFLNSWPEF